MYVYKGTETDVLYGVAIRPRGDRVIKGLKLTYYMAWKWRGELTPLLTRCSREASLFNCQMTECYRSR